MMRLRRFAGNKNRVPVFTGTLSGVDLWM